MASECGLWMGEKLFLEKNENAAEGKVKNTTKRKVKNYWWKTEKGNLNTDTEKRTVANKLKTGTTLPKSGIMRQMACPVSERVG